MIEFSKVKRSLPKKKVIPASKKIGGWLGTLIFLIQTKMSVSIIESQKLLYQREAIIESLRFPLIDLFIVIAVVSIAQILILALDDYLERFSDRVIGLSWAYRLMIFSISLQWGVVPIIIMLWPSNAINGYAYIVYFIGAIFMGISVFYYSMCMWDIFQKLQNWILAKDIEGREKRREVLKERVAISISILGILLPFLVSIN